MNAARHKTVADAIESLEAIAGVVEELRDAEEAALDNLPDSIRCSARGEAIATILQSLENVIASFDEALD